MAVPISLQTGLRDYNGDLRQYTGMLGGLTPDIHTLRSLNPETTNRVLCVMFRGPYFLMHYFGQGETKAYTNRWFATYKKMIEYYNLGVQCNFGDRSLASAQLQGGFAGRSINIPTVQNTNNAQSIIITVPELVGRPISNFHNMWIDGISDEVTGLTHYQGMVAGSVQNNIARRVFLPPEGGDDQALEPSPAWEVAEFLVIALDRSGARVEAAAMALGCIPQNKIGFDIFTSNPTGSVQIQNVQLSFSCQFIQSAYVNDLAARYVKQFAVFGNSLNLNPGAGDAFFNNPGTGNSFIDTPMFNNGVRPTLDAVQSSVGNAPTFYANEAPVQRQPYVSRAIEPVDHTNIYTNDSPDPETYGFAPHSIGDPYAGPKRWED